MDRNKHFLVNLRKIYPNFDLEELAQLNDLIARKLSEIERLKQGAKKVPDEEEHRKIREKIRFLRIDVEERKEDRDALLTAGWDTV